MTVPRIELTLGPVFFHWPANRLLDFYRRIADEAPIDRVYIGEVVCGKRMPFSDPAWPEIVERLEHGKKNVVLATLAMPSAARERRAVEVLCRSDHLVEINDLSALPARVGKPFSAGPFLNVYNEAVAQFLVHKGAESLCTPVELPLTSVKTIASACPDTAIEVFAFGRLPLALSGRCYHARIHEAHKDSCQFVCEKDLDGLAVDTLDGQPFLAVNGIQTLSNAVQVFCAEAATLAETGVSRLRLSPHTVDMVEVARIYRDLLDGVEEANGARFRISCLELPGQAVDGFLRGSAGARTLNVTRRRDDAAR